MYWGLVIGFVLLICLLLLIVITVPNIDKFSPSHIYDYKDIKNELDTGDLILLSGKTVSERFVCWYTGCIFSHVGMIVRIKDDDSGKEDLYIWEADIGQGAKRGTRLMPLDDKLARYKGYRKGAILKLDTPRKIYINDVVRIIKEHEKQDMDTTLLTYATSGYPRSYAYHAVKNDEKVFCSELIADTYQKLALMRTDEEPSFYTQKDFFKRNIPLQKDVSLGTPKFFTF